MSKIDKFFSYKIPQEYLNIIDEKFKSLFIKKMFLYNPDSFEPEIFGEYDEETDTYKEDEEIYYYPEPNQYLPIGWFNEVEGTGIWSDTLKEVCEELNKEELYKYWNSLPWYQSDLFDDQLSQIITRKLYIENKTKTIKK